MTLIPLSCSSPIQNMQSTYNKIWLAIYSNLSVLPLSNNLNPNMKKIHSLLFSAGLLLLSAGLNASYAKDVDLAEHFSTSSENLVIEIDNDAWNRILDAYIQENDGINLFGYSRVTGQDRALLNEYIEYLTTLPVSSLTAAQQFAYWTNLYNSLTIAVILDHYPVDSIRDISSSLLSRGPWKRKLIAIDGIKLGLDDIEHEILRPIFKDSRIHYAVNCASIGCPNLQPKAYAHETLDEMLDQAAVEYINHPRGVNVDQGNLTVSSLYKWYSEDFGENIPKIIDHLLVYAEPELASQLMAFDRISSYRYDWDLNEY